MSLKVLESSNRERWKIHLGNGSEFSIIKRRQFPGFEAQQISPKRKAEQRSSLQQDYRKRQRRLRMTFCCTQWNQCSAPPSSEKVPSVADGKEYRPTVRQHTESETFAHSILLKDAIKTNTSFCLLVLFKSDVLVFVLSCYIILFFKILYVI